MKLDFEQRQRASELLEAVIDDPDKFTEEVIFLRDEVERLLAEKNTIAIDTYRTLLMPFVAEIERLQAEKNALTIGAYRISRLPLQHGYWIGHDSDEGMQTSEDALAAAIDAYYKEHF